MLPFQRNKIDLSVSSPLHWFNDGHKYITIPDTGVFLQKLNPQEQQLFAKYGKLPTHKSVLMKMQKVQEFPSIPYTHKYAWLSLTRIANILIRVTMRCPRLELRLKVLSAQQSQIPRSMSICYLVRSQLLSEHVLQHPSCFQQQWTTRWPSESFYFSN